MRRKRDSGAEGGGGAAWRRALEAWLPVLLLECLVLYLSTRPGLHLPGRFPHLDKLAHFSEYALSGWLLFRALNRSGVRRLTGWLGAVAAVAALSAGDEWLQSHVPGRDSSPIDWLADLLGGMIGATLGGWWFGRAGRRGRGRPVIARETEG